MAVKYYTYDEFLTILRSDGIPWCASDIEKSGCKVMVQLDKEIPSQEDEKYEVWCKENCNNDYYVYNEHYVFFKTEEDAIAFKLVWQ